MIKVKQWKEVFFMQTVKMSSKNQIVIPKEAREAMRLKGNDELLVVVKGNITVIMLKPKTYRSDLAGAGKGIYPRTYLQKERKSW
ncbi:MAG: AbrB/MazE/SpoVT family DNA-binding domain-containing protein [Nitrospiraceae bacterium]|jgi:AbrB family looped-hinge helix DNA binding protein|nr:MAG: AbrB/MazE/SpoVT family DNA-binding domain-containing protein [Nitrospiraceae bacterium]